MGSFIRLDGKGTALAPAVRDRARAVGSKVLVQMVAMAAVPAPRADSEQALHVSPAHAATHTARGALSTAALAGVASWVQLGHDIRPGLIVAYS